MWKGLFAILLYAQPHFDLPRKPMYFWGKDDAPHKAAFSAASGAACEVELLDYKGRRVRGIWKGITDGKPREIDITPPAYGVFYVVASLGKERYGAPYAWLAAPAQPWPESPFGVQMHFAMGAMGRHQVLGGAAGALKLVRNMGASWFRDDLAWSQSELKKGSLAVPADAANPYYFAGPAGKLQLHPLVILNGGNVLYDGGQPPHSGEALQAYRNFAAAAARKLGPVAGGWEIWNEPNIAPGWPGRTPDPKEYTALLKAGWEGVKSADANAEVVGASTSAVDLKFIDQILRLGAAKYMDAISVHEYQRSPPEFPNEQPNGVEGMGLPDAGETFVGQLKNLEALLQRHDAGRLKVWITETGFVSQGRCTEAQIAACNVRACLLALALPFVERIFKYNFQDRGAPDSDHWDYVMGAVRADGSPKPSYVAFNTMARLLYKKHFLRALPVGEGLYLYEFGGEGGPVFAAWSAAGKKTLALQTGPARITRVDLMGNESAADARNLELSEEPVFLQCGGELIP